MLTSQQVESATVIGAREHPIIPLLHEQAEKLRQVSEQYKAKKPSFEQDKYSDPHLFLQRHYEQTSFTSRDLGFLADSVEALGDFSLGSLDAIAIWCELLRVSLCAQPVASRLVRHCN